ncbi:UNVERIFIED_CONTAM: hypothetical protein Sradi_2303400 [Sesamum radiatum]|uniref:Transmembrane protein n=1 Tax=Sesamum radiatum TaxID=300843 RepID=A0AAW2T7I2_SESRA
MDKEYAVLLGVGIFFVGMLIICMLNLVCHKYGRGDGGGDGGKGWCDDGGRGDAGGAADGGAVAAF